MSRCARQSSAERASAKIQQSLIMREAKWGRSTKSWTGGVERHVENTREDTALHSTRLQSSDRPRCRVLYGLRSKTTVTVTKLDIQKHKKRECRALRLSHSCCWRTGRPARSSLPRWGPQCQRCGRANSRHASHRRWGCCPSAQVTQKCVNCTEASLGTRWATTRSCHGLTRR